MIVPLNHDKVGFLDTNHGKICLTWPNTWRIGDAEPFRLLSHDQKMTMSGIESSAGEGGAEKRQNSVVAEGFL